MKWFPDKSKIIKNNIFSNVYFNSSSLISVSNIKTNSLKTIKIKFYPTDKQIKLLNDWFDLVLIVYNQINEFIKIVICQPKYFLNNKNNINISYTFIKDDKFINKILNWKNIRKMFTNEITDFIFESKTNIYKHTLDYSIKLCIEMYKSAYSNYKAGNIKHFNIKNLKPDRIRINFVIEPSNFSKIQNGFCVKHFDSINSDKLLNSFNINHNVIVQFNTNKYYFLIPIDESIDKTVYRSNKCGIDVRTFLTVYSNNKCYEIGNEITNLIDKYNKKLDNIQS